MNKSKIIIVGFLILSFFGSNSGLAALAPAPGNDSEIISKPAPLAPEAPEPKTIIAPPSSGGGIIQPSAPAKTSLPAPDSKTLKSNLDKINENLASFVASKSTKASLSLIQELEKNLSQIQSDLIGLKQELESKNLSSKIIARLDDFQTRYQNQITPIINGLKKGNDAEKEIKSFLQKPEVKIENPTPFRATEFKGEIKKLPVSEFPKTALAQKGDFIKNLVNSTVLKFKEVFNSSDSPASASDSPEPSSASSPAEPRTPNVSPPAPGDTLEAEEIQFTENIRNLATALENDPLTIFNYVANNVDYVPYYGSKKGADSTLLEKLGNDFDQASLLIGLLRVGNGQGQNQTPARYRQATVKLDVGRVMDLLGVEDPIVAATIFEKTGVPYILYADQNQTPQFFVLELTYVEAYVDYDYTRGIIQGNPGATKRWVPLMPFLAKFYKSQYLNVLDKMNFDISVFYENYLNGGYGEQKPIAALKGEIQNYISANHPDLTPEDTYVQTYRSEEDLEFLPLTLPVEVVGDSGAFSAAPENLKHRLEFSVESGDGSQGLLSYISNVSGISNKELTLEYVAATPEDQAVIDSFPTIYDVVPLSLVNVKPVIKVNGEIRSGGGAASPEVQMGRENKLKIIFKSPSKNIGYPVLEKIAETVEKANIAGNVEAIAINTDHIAPPEIRPSADTQSLSAVANQKLYKTAENFLYRLQSSHDELSRITGGRFTNSATRAVVFNGLEVSYQSGEPYSFSWQGLRIDASSLINYYSYFSQNPEHHQKEFMHVFGLEASQDEADIFEDDYNIESISTVKGLKLINQNQIPGIQVKKITSANESEINALGISDSTKTKLRNAVHQGHIVYVPSANFIYQSWNGLIYINIDPATGFGEYIIGEGLNGGYTVEQWPDGWQHFWRDHLIYNLTATIQSPIAGQIFMQDDLIPWQAYYRGDTSVPGLPTEWYDIVNLDFSNAPSGPATLKSGYGTNQSVQIILKGDTVPSTIDCTTNLEGRIIPEVSGEISEEMHLPLWIRENSGIFQYRLNDQVQYNKQDGIETHPTSREYFAELITPESTYLNVNNPWIDPETGKYWNMSIRFGAFNKSALSNDHEKYYMNMRWAYLDIPIPQRYEEVKWYFGKKVWIKNPATRKAVVGGILDYGPSPNEGAGGASLETLRAIGAKHDDIVEFCWAVDQSAPYGSVVSY